MGCGCFGELNWCKGKNNSAEAQTPGKMYYGLKFNLLI